MPSGTITEWDHDRGFGYVESNGQPLFLHFRDFTKRYKTPEVGDTVTFEIGKDKKGRPCAQKAVHVNEGGRLTSEAILFLCLLQVAPIFALVRLSRTIPGGYLAGYWILISVLAYFIYDWDKQRAKEKRYRESEFILHQLAVLGGWTGAFIAQRRLRHKCSKLRFQVVFWLIVAVHQFIAIDYLRDWKTTRQTTYALERLMSGK
jgi:uncharacterized membrane protein YsdA (DUF1294 family)/cold shock CspA family protein